MKVSRFTTVLLLTWVLSAAALAQTASLDLNMSLPAGWQAQQTPQGAMLFPEGASRAESYLVLVSPAPAGANLNTPGVAQAALQAVAGQFPGLQAVDSPRVCTVAGEPGLQVVLAGQDAMTGQRVAVSVWLAMSNGRTIMVSAAGQSDLIASRLEPLSQIAAGIRCSGVQISEPIHQRSQQAHYAQPAAAPSVTINPNIDPALVGAWQKSNSGSYVSSSYGSPGFSMSTATVTTIYLYPDGSGVCNVRSQMAGGTSAVSYDGTGGHGNNYPIAWAARGGVLDIRMQNGNGGPSRYQVSRDTLITYGPKGEQTVYRRVG